MELCQTGSKELQVEIYVEVAGRAKKREEANYKFIIAGLDPTNKIYEKYKWAIY